MTTFPTFCRITGHARNLPKPCYFPLLPPLSPADAKKLCKVTGKATDSHNYSPIISFGKISNFDGLEGCKITHFENFEFTRPTFIKYKENEKAIEHFTDLLSRMKTKRKKKVDVKKLFVYKINDQLSNIVLPPEVEEAIRTGEIEALSVSKDMSHLSVKIKQGRLVKVKIESIPKKEVNADDNYYYGEGQSKETLESQQQIINERNHRKQETMARTKIFEQKEKNAEEAARLATERPKSKKPPIKFDPLKRKQKLQKMGQMIEEQKDNKGIILPKFDPISKVNPDEQIRYEQMLQDLANAQRKSVNVTTVLSCKFDFSAMENAETAGFDWNSFPHEDVCEPFEITIIDIQTNDMFTVPNSTSLDIAASVETVEPAPEIDKNLLNAIRNLKDENLKTTENVAVTLKNLNSEKLIPSVKDIGKIVSEAENYTHGYLIQDKDGKGSKFVKKEDYNPGTDTGISGAMVNINNEQKFISGQFINLANEETFIAGQTIETPHGKRFIPGQTVINKNGEISFIAGQSVTVDEETKFVTGQVIDGKEGPQFMPGQMVDRGDKKPVFMSGQTVMTNDGPKFVPGEIVIDEDGYHDFVPGMKMLTSDGEKFIPGQAFQSDEGITFTPGQTVDTEEGPSFIPGKSFKTTEGNKKFVKGEMVKTEDGKLTFEVSKDKLEIPLIKEDLVESNDELVIPNDHLQLLAIAGRDVTGFLVKPTNTSNIQAGERLYGDLVETDKSVLFYLNGKLPKELPEDAKIISGELVVGETSQKFVPGRIMNTLGGEKFIPGQLVKTSHGEEFVPGQIVETSEGPKFVPGQLVMTSEGEKFIPGQVVMEEEGPKFVPGQIIQTENGATFIPGQMMSTEKGQKFVPGQLVETKDGLRFVPGQVVETNDGPKFISGTVVETEDGLKYLPSSANAGMEESEEESEISFQGFDISPEEMQLLSQNVSNARPRTPIGKEEGLIDSSTLKKLAADTMDIHGRTPEPIDKKKKKKRGKITIDALEEDEDTEEVDIEDTGTNKVEILKHLVKIGTSLSTFRKEKELKILSELLDIEEDSNENEAEMEALKFINSITSDDDLFESYIGNDEQIITDILSCIGNVDEIVRNDQVKNVINNAIKKCITKKCDEEINELINKITKNPESLFTDSKAQILLTEAVGVVCVTGDVEVASMLEKFISKPTNPECLREDEDVLAVLRQLLVLQRIAERNTGVARVLQELQDDPEGVKDRNKVRKLIREAKGLLVSEKKSKEKPFDVRHVASSKDIPKEVFEQIRKDKVEADKFMEKLPDELFKAIMGDERCGGKLIKSLDADPTGRSKKEIDKFKKGMAVVVAKDNMQAVIPKHYARSIYYGIMPYILIDEEGLKFFERGLTGRKLAPSRVIENTWFQPDSYYEKSVLYPQRVTPSGVQYNLVYLGDSYRKNAPSLEYTSLLPSSNPTTISYLDYQPRGSREGSVTSLRTSRSTTPSRKFSISSLHDQFPNGGDSYSRRNSLSSGQYPVPTIALTEGITNSTSKSSYSTPHSYEEDDEPSSLARSGTVGKLLDKYSNFSLSKEFGSSKPQKSYTRHNTVNSYPLSNDLNDSDHSAEYKPYSSTYTRSKHSSITPEKSREFTPRRSQDRFKDLSLTDVPLRTRRTLQRPISDIYEMDELDSPGIETGSIIRSSLIDTAKKNYESANSIGDVSPQLENHNSSYTDRLSSWKDKGKTIESDEEDDGETPRRISHNRYESVLTGEEDYNPRKSATPTKSLSYKSRRLDKDDYDDDDFSMDKFRESLRKKYSNDIDQLGNTLKAAYSIPSPSNRAIKAGSFDLNSEDTEKIGPRKTRKYGGCRSDSLGPEKYKTSNDDMGIGLKNNDPLDIPNGRYGREGSYDYGGGYASPYGQPSLYNQPNLYGQPMGYGQPTGYRQPYGGGYGTTPMYGNNYEPNRNYGSSMYGGAGGTYSQGSPYMPAYSPMRYGAGGYNMPMNRGYPTPGPYSGYGGVGPYGGGYQGGGSVGGERPAYGGINRRYGPRVNLSKYDDDDDDDISSYNPRKDRELASKIAKKYLGDSDEEEE